MDPLCHVTGHCGQELNMHAMVVSNPDPAVTSSGACGLGWRELQNPQQQLLRLPLCPTRSHHPSQPAQVDHLEAAVGQQLHPQTWLQPCQQHPCSAASSAWSQICSDAQANNMRS